MSFRTIKKSNTETELLFIKARLEAEGITCFLKNEFTSQIMTHMTTFQVELQVPEEDLEKALTIVNEIEKA